MQLAEQDRDCRDTYLIEILRALDRRIARVSAMVSALPAPGSLRHRAASAEHRELTRRLADLKSAREDLVDVVFRCSG
jgi:hypothetical protein